MRQTHWCERFTLCNPFCGDFGRSTETIGCCPVLGRVKTIQDRNCDRPGLKALG